MKSIAATRLSANTTAGFSIATFTGTGSAATVAHGLGVTPELVFVKGTDIARDWLTWDKYLTSATYYMLLNASSAEADDSGYFGAAPTPSVVNLGTYDYTNGSGSDYVIYSFASIEGYSKIGSFTGNQDADGPFIFTGFETAWVLIKKYSAAGDNWYILDNTRNLVYNPVNYSLYPDENTAEGTGGNYIDFLSNGFKIRNNYTSFNGDGTDMLYMAFAESPFKCSNAR